MKAKKMGDGHSGAVKSPAKVAKTSEDIRKPLGTIPETKVEGCEIDKQVEESHDYNQPSSKYHIAETSLSYNHIFNSTLSSFTPLKPTP